MRKIAVVIFILAFMTTMVKSARAAEERPADKPSPFQEYKPCYIITGDADDQLKFLISFKYRLFKAFGLFAGYSQLSLWDIYDESAPFRDSNFNPELFYKWEWAEDSFLQFGFYEHKSNGRAGLESRGLDRGYLQAQFATNTGINAGLGLKAWGYYNLAPENGDFYEYTGPGEVELFLENKLGGSTIDKERLYVKGGIGGAYLGREQHGHGGAIWGADKERYWVEAGLKFRFILPVFMPYLYVQVYHGYAESLLEYDRKETRIRAGFILD